MPAQITAKMEQQSLTATKGTARQFSVLVDRPPAKDGTDEGMMGGEMLLVALGGCFMSNLLEIVRTREANITNINVDVVGTMAEDKPTRYASVELQVSAEHDNRDEFEKFVTMAERGCLVANTLKQGLNIRAVVVTQSPVG
jgi:putative redox protein